MDSDPSAKKRPQILVVDDTAVARAFVNKILGQDHDLVQAAGGREALEKIAAHPPDVILLDMMMPEMDGIEVCQRIKANPATVHIPIIMMTSLNRTEERVRSLDAGADDFLPKPFEGVELLARLRSMLRIKRQFDNLQAAMQQRESMGQMIVHDLRSPLTSMTLALGALDHSSLPPDSQVYVRQVNDELRRINGFLTELLALAKMDAGQMTLSRSPIDVAALLQQAVTSHQLLAQSKNLSIDLETSTEFTQWPLDSLVFQRVIDNLLSNAIKFSPRGERIAIRLSYPQDRASGAYARRLLIQVADHGAGVPPEHQPHLFGRFRTFGGGDRSVQQIGLGLAFCKMAIEAHGGAIRYLQNEPQGSIFAVDLPGKPA